MAERPHKSRGRKSQPIEPLDWSVMAHSPALKGMVSFLEVTPEDIRRQRTTANDTHTGSGSHTGSESQALMQSTASPSKSSAQELDLPISELIIGIDSLIGSESLTGRGLPAVGSERISELRSSTYRHNTSPAPDGQSLSKDEPLSAEPLNAQISELYPGSNALRGSDAHTGSESHTVTVQAEAGLEDHEDHDSRTGSESHTGTYSSRDIAATLIGVAESQKNGLPVSDTLTGRRARSTYFVPSDPYSRAPRRMPMLQGEVVWQNRKIRKCVLAQDAHSQGEDALFSAMWSAAKSDPGDPTGSRTLRIGYAELAQKSRMHRSNVRINIGGLRAKLAIEVLDEHDSRDVTPRTYRLYSFKEILERRRVAGLEYVIRKKSVIFVTETGEAVPLPGLPKAHIRRTKNADADAPSELRPLTKQDTSPEQIELDVRQISDALSQHWPVDQAAAQQLLRQCRGVRRDAEINEIVFFVNEKLQIALTNPNIKNPTGLILATVPQCFEGSTFEEFRRRRNDALRQRAEEDERKRQQERDLQLWLERKLQELRTIAEDISQSETSREKARRELKQYGG